jgi:hypothetical protein
MFTLGLVVVAGTTIYCAITGDWPSSKYIGTGMAYAAGVWMLFAPVRDAIWGRPGKKKKQTVQEWQPPRL